MKLNLTVMSKTGMLFNGEVHSITALNKSGAFDVLPDHENFISIITEDMQIVGVDGRKQLIPVRLGLMKVTRNQVQVFLDLEAR
ncbi:hypothetical protein C4579_01145 [Candidatus Microgenomates bacterium]|nr:MAG: hypothetical protein C4579_01145 [Candidatus Microgenomates bacterium]